MSRSFWWPVAIVIFTALGIVSGYCIAPLTASSACEDAPAACTPCQAEKSPPQANPKQHIHFVMDDLRFGSSNTEQFKIKRIEFEYKGDGIEGDVMKCFLTLFSSSSASSTCAPTCCAPCPAPVPSDTPAPVTSIVTQQFAPLNLINQVTPAPDATWSCEYE